ncbi:MAG: hypothetical protein AAGJ79_00810 [Verrucomicrobiota bacterium]
MKAAYRSQKMGIDPHVVGFSISYEKDNLLARGLGLEHLQEMMIRLARTILRNNHNLAYGGDWGERPENFTYLLLNLISAEQQDQQDAQKIGRLYNHLAWPFYSSVTPEIEAKWIDCCRIVRIDQEKAGIPVTLRLSDEEIFNAEGKLRLFDPSVAPEDKKQLLLNTAICLSVMRRTMQEQFILPIPDMGEEIIPSISGRILLGGKVAGYTGFLPGIFEEALYTLEGNRPLYPLGGFGGCAELIAKAILQTGPERPKEFTVDWHLTNTPVLSTLMASLNGFPGAPAVMDTKGALDALWQKIEHARHSPSTALNTGLTDDETREVLQTRDMDRLVKLLRQGFASRLGLDELAG